MPLIQNLNEDGLPEEKPYLRSAVIKYDSQKELPQAG